MLLLFAKICFSHTGGLAGWSFDDSDQKMQMAKMGWHSDDLEQTRWYQSNTFALLNPIHNGHTKAKANASFHFLIPITLDHPTRPAEW